MSRLESVEQGALLKRIYNHLRFIYRYAGLDELELWALVRRLHRLMRLDEHCDYPRPHHNPQHRCFACPGGGGLAAAEHEAAGRVGCQNLSVKY